MNDIGIIHLTNGGFAVVDADLVRDLSRVKFFTIAEFPLLNEKV